MTENDRDLAELQRRVNRIHAATSGAEDAPPELWQRVLAQANPEPKETHEMSSATLRAETSSSPRGYSGVQSYPSVDRRGFSHYLNLAATIALVTAVAIGGWFAMVQINQPNTPDPRFAALYGTPESADAICDVEPLTVDEAMIILVNPYRFMEVDEDYAQNLETLEWLKDQTGQTGQPPLDRLLTENPNGELQQDELDAALDMGDNYLACVQHGTQAQVFRLMDPVGVHEYLRGVLPLFTSEEEARVIIEEILNQPGNNVWTQDDMHEYLSGKSIRMSRDRDQMYIDSSYAADHFLLDAIVIAPVAIYDDHGEVVFETTFSGFPVKNNGRSTDYARNVSIAKSPFNGEWYVFNIYHP